MILGAKIEVVRTGEEFHTIDDWDLTITNRDYIGTPNQETGYIDIPGRNGFIDISETLSGRRIFKDRQINISLGGIRPRANWDLVVSDLRNKIHGETVHVIFDNDISHFWVGRIYLQRYNRSGKVGTFVLSMPKADPYKYNIMESSDPWLWDPFSFVDGVIQSLGDIVVSGSATVSIPSGTMEVSPVFLVANITSGTFTVTYNGTAYTLTAGSNRHPEIIVNGSEEVDLTFTGSATVSIVYRGGSL